MTNSFPHIERAVLLEDLENTNENVKGKFYIPVLPLSDSPVKSPESRTHSSPSSKGFKTKLVKSGYTTNTYTELIIPKYLTFQFDEIIPKGTEFLICAVGGIIFNQDTLRIIGIYTL